MVGVVLIGAAAPAADAQSPTLREVTPPAFRMGAALSYEALGNDRAYASTAASQYSLAVPENAMKWDHIHPQRTAYDFTQADAVVDFATRNDMAVRGHPLVWGYQLPTWLKQTKWSRSELIAIMRDHIRTVMRRYRDRVHTWDVVNEAVGQNNLWKQVIGYPGYVVLAFKFASQADPTAKLFYNDVGAEGKGARSDAVYDLMVRLRKELPKAPMGVGLQMHTSLCPPYGVACPPAPADVGRNMRRLTRLNLDVGISEMDVRLDEDTGDEPQALEAQADVYRQMLQACLAVTRCHAFTTWGFTDRASWIPGYFPGTGHALPFDDAIAPKPAFFALCGALRKSSC